MGDRLVGCFSYTTPIEECYNHSISLSPMLETIHRQCVHIFRWVLILDAMVGTSGVGALCLLVIKQPRQ